MAKSVTMGKLRGLQRTSTANGIFTALAIDHQDALRRAFPVDDPSALEESFLTRFKLDVVDALKDDISGVLLDPRLSAAQAIGAQLVSSIGLLVELEKADYRLEPMPLDVEIDPAWSVTKIKRMGADAVKLFYYYNPAVAEHAARQDAVIKQVAAECTQNDIPLFAEPIIYPDPNGSAAGTSAYVEQFQKAVMDSAQRGQDLGADILKLEFPVNVHHQTDEGVWAEACAQLSGAVDVPWVLLSAGVDFATFARQVWVACQNGASGFLVGRAVWGDAAKFLAREDWLAWLHKEGRQRIQTLAEIAQTHATPWTEHIFTNPISSDWYITY